MGIGPLATVTRPPGLQGPLTAAVASFLHARRLLPDKSPAESDVRIGGDSATWGLLVTSDASLPVIFISKSLCFRGFFSVFNHQDPERIRGWGPSSDDLSTSGPASKRTRSRRGGGKVQDTDGSAGREITTPACQLHDPKLGGWELVQPVSSFL